MHTPNLDKLNSQKAQTIKEVLSAIENQRQRWLGEGWWIDEDILYEVLEIDTVALKKEQQALEERGWTYQQLLRYRMDTCA